MENFQTVEFKVDHVGRARLPVVADQRQDTNRTLSGWRSAGLNPDLRDKTRKNGPEQKWERPENEDSVRCETTH